MLYSFLFLIFMASGCFYCICGDMAEPFECDLGNRYISLCTHRDMFFELYVVHLMLFISVLLDKYAASKGNTEK